jgi:hypothetical protein
MSVILRYLSRCCVCCPGNGYAGGLSDEVKQITLCGNAITGQGSHIRGSVGITLGFRPPARAIDPVVCMDCNSWEIMPQVAQVAQDIYINFLNNILTGEYMLQLIFRISTPNREKMVVLRLS